MENISEARLQCDCFLWFHNAFPDRRGLLFKVTNEVHRHAGERTGPYIARISRLKAEGLVPGIADMILIHPLTCFEFKTDSGIQSPEQIRWQKLVQLYSIPYYLIRSLEQFQQIICGTQVVPGY
jgi:hypothetical protein